MWYRCDFFGASGHIQRRVEYEAEGDELAIIEARAQYAESRFNAGFEVLQTKRLVYRENTETLREELHSRP